MAAAVDALGRLGVGLLGEKLEPRQLVGMLVIGLELAAIDGRPGTVAGSDITRRPQRVASVEQAECGSPATDTESWSFQPIARGQSPYSSSRESGRPLVRPRAGLLELISQGQQRSFGASSGTKLGSDRQSVDAPMQRH
jgi:hypothetical protein